MRWGAFFLSEKLFESDAWFRICVFFFFWLGGSVWAGLTHTHTPIDRKRIQSKSNRLKTIYIVQLRHATHRKRRTILIFPTDRNDRRNTPDRLLLSLFNHNSLIKEVGHFDEMSAVAIKMMWRDRQPLECQFFFFFVYKKKLSSVST